MQGITFDRLMSFAVSSVLWLNQKASPRVAAAYESYALPGGKLDYDSFKAAFRNLMAWNEPSNVRA